MMGKRRLPLTLLVLLSGCTDPMDRPGTWHAQDNNTANLAAGVVNKPDLLRGEAEDGADGQLAAAAIARLRADKVKPLNETSTMSTGGSSGGGGSGGAN